MIVAIDGPAGSGKSTVAHAIAERHGLTFLDTGAMYRAVTLSCLERGVDVADASAAADVARGVRIDFDEDAAGAQTVLLDGRDVTAQIREARIDQSVSAVASVPAVREALVERQRELGRDHDVVAEGRDIGTVVFPDADVKVFLTADARARAHRRAVQREGGDAATVAADAERKILEDIERRDRLDSTREASPLVAAADAHHIDSSHMTVDEVVEQIGRLMKEAR